MERKRKTQAVVVGAGVAGLMAARVLTEHFDEVAIVERDRLPEEPKHRSGVPQGQHVHVLLKKGQQIIERYFPGVEKDWLDGGATFVDCAADFSWLGPQGWWPRFDSGVSVLAASRPLIERGIRKRVEALPKVTFIQEAEVISPITDSGQTHVTGVMLRFRMSESRTPADVLRADLVVDTMGRSTKTPAWLERMGYGRPAETVVDSRIAYVTRTFRRDPESRLPYRATYSQAAPPENCRGGLAFPVEGDRWVVTLSAGGGAPVPSDEAGFSEFARLLPNPQIYEIIRNAEPLTRPVGFGGMENRMRHYERQVMPKGLAVLGDAACTFNPVYGQGMSTAAIAAETLDACLRERRMEAFQKELAAKLATPWLFATSEDLRYPGAGGADLRLRVMNWYLDRVMSLATRDIPARRRLIRVLNMLEEPEVLFHPAVAAPALLPAWLRRLPEPTPQKVPA